MQVRCRVYGPKRECLANIPCSTTSLAYALHTSCNRTLSFWATASLSPMLYLSRNMVTRQGLLRCCHGHLTQQGCLQNFGWIDCKKICMCSTYHTIIRIKNNNQYIQVSILRHWELWLRLAKIQEHSAYVTGVYEAQGSVKTLMRCLNSAPRKTGRKSENSAA